MTTTLQPGRYDIDAHHSSVGFSVRHMMIATVRGRFTEVSGTVEVPQGGTPRVDVTIDAASINTASPMRDEHLRSADFFDVATYPVVRFTSTSAERSREGWTLTGDLTLRGVTRPVTLAVTEVGAAIDESGVRKVAFTAAGKLNRTAFGLTWNAALETGGVLVGEEITLDLEVQLAAQAGARAA